MVKPACGLLDRQTISTRTRHHNSRIGGLGRCSQMNAATGNLGLRIRFDGGGVTDGCPTARSARPPDHGDRAKTLLAGLFAVGEFLQAAVVIMVHQFVDREANKVGPGNTNQL